MHQADSLLAEYQVVANEIADQHLDKFRQAIADNPENKFNKFVEIIFGEYRSVLARAGTDLFHKSIMEGVDDQMKLITGVQQVNFDTTQRINRALESM